MSNSNAFIRKLLIVVATYNERESLPTLIEQLVQHLPSAQLLVVDDNSPDGTGLWCEQAQARFPQLSVIHRDGKHGLGSATILGLQAAIRDRFDFVATMDADLSHDPLALRQMFANACKLHPETPFVLIGSRYAPGGTIAGWPWYRRLSSYLVNLFARAVLRLPSTDNTSAFRVYSVEALKRIELSNVRSHGYSYLEEILLLLNNAKVTFVEYPIAFQNRASGSSKVNFAELLGSLSQILVMALRPTAANRR